MANPFALLTSDDYLDAIRKLMPRGLAWAMDALSTPVKSGFWQAVADGFGQLRARIGVLSEVESDPRLTEEMIDDWEAALGLPDPCIGPLPTLGQRHAAVVNRLNDHGGQSGPYFVALAASLGYAVTIARYPVFGCDSTCDDSIAGINGRSFWKVSGPATVVFNCSCNDGCDSPLQSATNTQLQCEFNRRQPAQGTIVYNLT